MIRFRRIYGVPEPLQRRGHWPVHRFPAWGSSPESLMDHCRSAVDWARILVWAAGRAQRVSPEYLGVVSDRLRFEVDLVKRNILARNAVAA